MDINYLKPFRISLKLGPGKAPHLYVKQIQEMMKNDSSLHPMMKRTLLLLKKTRTPYVILAITREVVIDPVNNRHFDRSVEPQRGDWICTLWSEEEKKQHATNPKEHVKASLKLFEALGYELFDATIVSDEYLQSLEELTRSQIESQLKGRGE